MGRNQARRREMETSLLKRHKKLWILSRGPRHCDSFVGNAFGEMQHANAVVEHRRTRLPEIEPSGIDLREMCDQFGLVQVIAHH